MTSRIPEPAGKLAHGRMPAVAYGSCHRRSVRIGVTVSQVKDDDAKPNQLILPIWCECESCLPAGKARLGGRGTCAAGDGDSGNGRGHARRDSGRHVPDRRRSRGSQCLSCPARDHGYCERKRHKHGQQGQGRRRSRPRKERPFLVRSEMFDVIAGHPSKSSPLGGPARRPSATTIERARQRRANPVTPPSRRCRWSGPVASSRIPPRIRQPGRSLWPGRPGSPWRSQRAGRR